MIPALLTGSLLAAATLSAPAKAEDFRLDRIEFLSDDTGMWLNYDLPMVGIHPATTGLRLVEQTQLVWALPLDKLRLGTSIDSQSVTYERGFNVDIGDGALGWYGGISMRLFLPRGLTAGIAWQTRHWRLAAGTAASSAATWRRPSLKVWTVVPTISVALVTGQHKDGGKRFRGEPVDRSQFRTDPVPPGMPAEPGVETTPSAEAPVEQAPAVQTEAPAVQTEAPAVQTEAPAVQTEAPAVQTEAPVDEAATAPTGPTAVEFSGPTRVVLPGSAPVKVIIGTDSTEPTDTKPDEDDTQDSSPPQDTSDSDD